MSFLIDDGNTQYPAGGKECSQSRDRQVSRLENLLDPHRCYSVPDLAQICSLSSDLIRRLFVHEPGVLVIKNPRKGYRTYRTLRIPGWVAIRVFKQLTNGEQR
jgi:hypothetical protein